MKGGFSNAKMLKRVTSVKRGQIKCCRHLTLSGPNGGGGGVDAPID